MQEALHCLPRARQLGQENVAMLPAGATGRRRRRGCRVEGIDAAEGSRPGRTESARHHGAEEGRRPLRAMGVSRQRFQYGRHAANRRASRRHCLEGNIGRESKQDRLVGPDKPATLRPNIEEQEEPKPSGQEETSERGWGGRTTQNLRCTAPRSNLHKIAGDTARAANRRLLTPRSVDQSEAL